MIDNQKILSELKEDFPEIFVGETISLTKLSSTLEKMRVLDNLAPERKVFIEKTGFLSGQHGKLIRKLNKLNPNY